MNSLVRQFGNLRTINSLQVIHKRFYSAIHEEKPAVTTSTTTVSAETTETATRPSDPDTAGLYEFFDSPDNWGEQVVRVGRPWRVEELRLKSNSDLHKLWFVLYKEKNMLLTMQEAHKEEGRVFPSEERIEKVEESMENLEKIVRERNAAYFKLEVAEDATAERSMAFRQDQFGRWRWQPIYEHFFPYKVSKNWRTVFGPGHGKDVTEFLRAWKERRRNAEYAKLKAQHHCVRNLLRRFPNIDLDHLQRKYPKVPVQYVKENLNFDPEYKRLVSKGAYEEAH